MKSLEIKKIKIVKKGEDTGNVEYWLKLTPVERLIELERLRKAYNDWRYGHKSRFQRVYRVVKRA